MTASLQIVTKAYDFLLYLIPQVAKFPRSETGGTCYPVVGIDHREAGSAQVRLLLLAIQGRRTTDAEIEVAARGNQVAASGRPQLPVIGASIRATASSLTPTFLRTLRVMRRLG